MIRFRTWALLSCAAALVGCNLAPTYVRSVANYIPPQWPSGAPYAATSDARAGMPWRTLATDAKLRGAIERALGHNQDLAEAVATVAAARATYQVQRSSQLPTVTANAGATIQRPLTGPGTASTASSTLFEGSVGITGFEIDLFGRQRNLSRAAFEQYLATASGARSTRFAIVAETATAYTTLAADGDLLALAKEQATSSARTVKLTQALHDAGLVSGLDVASAATLLAQASSDVEAYTTQVAQDRNALGLLLGVSVEDSLLPTSLIALAQGVGKVPVGISSMALLDRPDVVEAEHQLKSAGASIGAARAAFFPAITLTTALGLASPALARLFSGGTSFWSAAPSAAMPLLGGTNRGNLAYARAQADYDLAAYRKAAQTAYRDIADGLARRGTIDRQKAAQSDLVSAASKTTAIADARYRAGSDSFLTVLIAQRELYAARQAAVSIDLADLNNRIALYQAVGSDDTL
jgi:multidrug efflux system outer membrane protein